jgi:hypothetical protein
MGENIRPWSREYLGREITPEQFLASPELQDQLFDLVFGGYVKQHGLRGAASKWFTGSADEPERSDVLGKYTGKTYADQFVAGLGVPVDGARVSQEGSNVPQVVKPRGGVVSYSAPTPEQVAYAPGEIEAMLGLGMDTNEQTAAMARRLRGQQRMGQLLSLSQIGPIAKLGETMLSGVENAAQRGGVLREAMARQKYEEEQTKLEREQALQDRVAEQQYEEEVNKRELAEAQAAAEARATGDVAKAEQAFKNAKELQQQKDAARQELAEAKQASKPKVLPTTEERKNAGNFRAMLQNAIELSKLRKSKKLHIGPWEGLATEIATGEDPVQGPIMHKLWPMSPEDVEAQNRSGQLLSQMSILLSGLTVSDVERKLIKSYLPRLRQSEEAFDANLELLLETLRGKARSLYENAGLEVPEDLASLLEDVEEAATNVPPKAKNAPMTLEEKKKKIAEMEKNL